MLKLSPPDNPAAAAPVLVGGAIVHGIGACLGRTATKLDCLLTRRRVRLYPAVFLLCSLSTYLAIIAVGGPPLTAGGDPIAMDLTAHVTAGRIASSGQLSQLYDLERQQATQQEILGPGHDDFFNLYLSPPFVAYLYAPFAALPYLAAVGLWTALSVGLIYLSLRLLWPLVPNLHRHGFGAVLFLALTTQAIVETLFSGQDAALSLVIFAGGFRLLHDRRELAAGALLGLGVFKPQLFLLVPIFLIIQRRWYAAAAWLGVAGGLALGSIALVGPTGVTAYLRLLTSPVYTEGIAELLAWKMQSLVALVKHLAPPASTALDGNLTLVFGITTIAVGGILLAALLRRAPHRSDDRRTLSLAFAATVLVTALVNPHFFLYDCAVLLVPALLVLDAEPRRRATRLTLAALYILTWTTPIRFLAFGDAPTPVALLAAPWTAVVVGALLWGAWQLLGGRSRPAGPAGPPARWPVRPPARWPVRPSHPVTQPKRNLD